MANASKGQAKVVIIDTQYIVTDPLSFKSVVQSLTGKDSCVSWIEESSFTGGNRKTEADTSGSFESSDSDAANGAGGGGGSSDAADWTLSKGFSFKDLDRMILELPPVEEWYQLWTQNNLL